MIGVGHASVSLVPIHRRDEEIFRQLDLGGSEARLQRLPLLTGKDVAALHSDDLAPGDGVPGEQPTAVNRALAHFRVRRPIRQISHAL
jgi:hypothetical protein